MVLTLSRQFVTLTGTGKAVRVFFLRTFATLQKATVNFVMSVRPSVRMEQLGSHWTDFR